MPNRRISDAVIDVARSLYVTSDAAISIRALAKKSGISERTLFQHSVDEGWKEQRRKVREELAARSEEAEAAERSVALAERAEVRASVSGSFTGKMVAFIEFEKGLVEHMMAAVADRLLPETARQAAQKAIAAGAKGVDPEEAARLVREEWDALPLRDRIALATRLPEVHEGLARMLDMYSRRPAEEEGLVDATGPVKLPPLTPDEEYAVAKVWDSIIDQQRQRRAGQ